LARSESLGFGLPTHRDLARTLAGITRQMAFAPPPLWGCQEKRFPFLDQTMIEFLISIPPDQVLRPGQRRSLMRRSLANLLPPEVLSRTTKATTARSHMVTVDMQWRQLENVLGSAVSSQLGYINTPALLDALGVARIGKAPSLVTLLRAVCLEVWLQDLLRRRVIRVGTPSHFYLERVFAHTEG